MANNIKGLTVEIGGDTTKLGKALEDVNKKSRDLSSELGEINRALKLDPGNTELLAQKQQVLAEAVSNTAKKLDTLKQAEKQVQAQFERGEVSEAQVRALQREIITTESKMNAYEKAAKETAEAIDKLGNESDEAADDVRDLSDESDELDSSLDNLGNGFNALVGLVTAASAAVVGCVEATREYRTEIGKLNTAYGQAGHSTEAATETYKELQSVLGETDQAVEAANHLALLAKDEEDLAKASDALIGVYATFGASLPIEGLAEAANETAKVGSVTGGLADAINWANAKSDDWTAALGGNKKALATFNKAVKEGESSEDAFNAALTECSDEQERQELIIDTLSTLYGSAAAAYKRTNKAVIEANKANEEWTATLADIGETVEPVITDVKEFGTSLLKDAKKPLESVADFISDKGLPALQSVSSWARDSGPEIKATFVGLTAALVAYKVATIAVEVAHKGLKATIMATTVAQKALNLAQAATPWGLVAVAIAGVVTALLAYTDESNKAAAATTVLTDEEKALQTAAQETAAAFRDQQAATATTFSSISSQMTHVTALATELQTLADNSGKVEEADRTRAQFILNELNAALGTEYTMVDGVIQKYGELKTSINDVIAAKTANALLEAGNEAYVAAIQAENDAVKRLSLAEQDYRAQLTTTSQAEKDAAEAKLALQQKLAKAQNRADYEKLRSAAEHVASLEQKAQRERELLEEKKAEYDDAAADYGNYSATINNYENAQAAILEGNYTKAQEILAGKSTGFADYAGTVDTETAKVLDTLYKEAVDAGIAAEQTKQNFNNGVDGYTQDMVDEAVKGYEDALNAYADAYSDAHDIGSDIGSGLADGMESQRFSVINTVRSIVDAVIAAARSAADSHSPSRKMIDFGEDMGEGAVIGMENKTNAMLGTARRQVDALMRTYTGDQPPVGQTLSRKLTSPGGRADTSAAGVIASNAALLAKLDGIYERLNHLQVVTETGALVGEILDKVDIGLANKQVLTARGV